MYQHCEGGYLGFKEASDSDHQTLWIWVDEKEVLGYNLPEAKKRKSNRLKSDDPRRTNRYLTQVNRRFEETDLAKQAKVFWHKGERGWIPLLERQYNEIH